MLELRDLVGLPLEELAQLRAAVAPLQILADVAQRFRVLEVVVQDEFTHDVIAAGPGGRVLVFDAT